VQPSRQDKTSAETTTTQDRVFVGTTTTQDKALVGTTTTQDRAFVGAASATNPHKLVFTPIVNVPIIEQE
jgi:hypothetical protein